MQQVKNPQIFGLKGPNLPKPSIIYNKRKRSPCSVIKVLRYNYEKT